MASSLTAQLADLAKQNPDAARLASAKALKTRDSYLFTGRQAAHQSLDEVHTIGLEGQDELADVDAAFEGFKGPLFGEGAKRLDRTLLPKTEVDALDEQIEAFLLAVGPHVLVKSSAKALEWLIRRFRINEFNVPALLATFLPYYATPQFASMLHILHLKPHHALSWLIPVQATRAPLPREHLVDSLCKHSEALRYFADILPGVLRHDPSRVHRALIGLHLTTLLSVFDHLATKKRSKAAESPFSPTTLGILIPSLRAGAQAKANPEVQLASYVLVSALVQRAKPSVEVVEGFVKLVAGSRHKVPEDSGKVVEGTSWIDCDEALVRTLVVLYQSLASTLPAGVGLPPLTATSASRITKLGNLGPMLEHIATRFDISAFWTVFSRALAEGASGDSPAQAKLLLHFAHAQLDDRLVISLMRALLDVSSSLAEPSPALQKPFSILAQKHAQHLDTLAQSLIAFDPARKPAIEAVVRLVILGEGTSEADLAQSDALALVSGNTTVRESALERALKAAPQTLESGDHERIEGLRKALNQALVDPASSVAQLLLRHGEIVVRALPVDDFLSSVRLSLASEGLSRAILKAHLSLLCGPFVTQHRADADVVAEDFVAWRLLVTKSGAKAVGAVWSVVSEGEAGVWKGTVLEGVAGIATGTEGPEAAVTMNAALIERVCRNLGKKPEGVVRLVGAAAAPDAPVQLKLLVLSVLLALPKTKGQFTIDPTAAILRLLGPGLMEVASDRARWAAVSLSAADVQAIPSAVYSKTTSPKTFARLAVATLQKLLGEVSAPATEWIWFETSGSSTADHRLLVQELFSLVHATDSLWKSDPSSLAAQARAALSDRLLGESTVAFLASVWTSSAWREEERCAALMDAATCVPSEPLDYQLVLPGVLIALADPSRAVRAAALRLVDAIAKVYASAGGQELETYGFDRFYGPKASGGLRYLSTSDAAALVETLSAAREELLLDGAFVKTVLDEQLAARDARSGKKVKSGLRHGVVCFLLAGVGAWPTVAPRIGILRCVSTVRDQDKANSVAPYIRHLLGGTLSAEVVNERELGEYARLLVEALVKSPKKVVEGKEPANWALLLEVVEASGDAAGRTAVRDAALGSLGKGLLAAIQLDRRLELLQLLIRLAVSQRPDAASYAVALRSVRLDAPSLAVLLVRLAEGLPVKPVKAHKKAKTSQGSMHGIVDADSSSRLIELAVLLENVAFDRMDASPDLIYAMIDTLRVLNEAHSHTQADVHFSAQLLVSALVASSQRLSEPLDGAKLRLAPVMDYMRISPNPYVAQQAMLFIAEIAPKAPEEALQSVMPIFTFVGANVLHRDDSASARTVEKMLQALVPPIVDAAKAEGQGRVKTVQRLRGLIMAFVGAATHVPHHRRLRLFVRLVEVLGVYDFLGAVVILLVHSDPDGSQSGADLALRLWESFSGPLAVASLAHVVSEIEALTPPSRRDESIILGGDADDEVLDDTTDQHHSDIGGLLGFVRSALSSRSLAGKLDSARSLGETDIDAVLSHFLRMAVELSRSATTAPEVERATSMRDISNLAAHLLSLNVLSDALLGLLQSDDATLGLHALSILQSRLPTLKTERRPELESSIKSAIVFAERQLDSKVAIESGGNVSVVLDALSAISESPANGELNALGAVMPRLLRLATSAPAPTLAASSLATVERISRHLGPRLIAHIGLAIESSRRLIFAPADRSSGLVVSRAYAVLAAVTSSASPFLTPHLRSLVGIASESSDSTGPKAAPGGSAKVQFVTALVKSAKLGELSAAIAAGWSQAISVQSMTSLLDLLQRSVKYSRPAEASASSKAIFSFLLSAFDVRQKAKATKMSPLDVLAIEKAALDVFMALIFKLSEQTLKPLLLRLIDWAVIAEPGQASAAPRRIILFKVFSRLLNHLKSIGLPFFVFVLDHVTTTLESFPTSSTVDAELWDGVVSVLDKSVDVDSIGFWTSQRLNKVLGPMTSQLTLAPKLGEARVKTALVPLIGSLASKISAQDALLKILNSNVLRSVRSDDLRVKRAGIEALDAMWQALGYALVPLIPETVGAGLAEALEEPEGGVEAAARKLLARIEGELGGESIDSYLA